MARLAVRAERAADEVLGERSRLGSAAGAMRWKSTAASSFAHRARAGEDTLRADAETLTELAALLRQHAREVEEHLQVLADVARRAELLAEQGVEAVSDAAVAAAGVVSDGVSGTGRAVESAGRWLGDRAPW
jgi:ABC-type transporter Mla subunit MlaD